MYVSDTYDKHNNFLSQTLNWELAMCKFVRTSPYILKEMMYKNGRNFSQKYQSQFCKM